MNEPERQPGGVTVDDTIMTNAVLSRRTTRDGVLFHQFRTAAISGDEAGALDAAITIHDAATRVAVIDVAVEAACVAAFINHLIGDPTATIHWARLCLTADPTRDDHPCAPLAHALYAAAAVNTNDPTVASHHLRQAQQLLASEQPHIEDALTRRLTNLAEQRLG